MVFTASKSPGEAAANPASITLTLRSLRACAIFNFSPKVMLQPGACSPSLRVVSKIITSLDWFMIHPLFLVNFLIYLQFYFLQSKASFLLIHALHFRSNDLKPGLYNSSSKDRVYHYHFHCNHP